ncbi:MAG: type II toxin-antitoxin system RelE/ParE family toxin [Candidatus Aenigmarchaeota archaeon]|nr:type II toxin-antitoxin system RelE/ParE family toxin [Candidatus Aenigmarchaeota archaeon]
MDYQVKVPLKVQREIKKKLDKYLQKRMDKKMQKLKKNPKTFGKPLRFPLAGVWEIYFEKRWRVLYFIDEKNKIIQIIGLKHKDEMKHLF